MKKIIFMLVFAFLLIAACSCKKPEEPKQNVQITPTKTANPYGFDLEEAAKASGKRMQQVARENEKNNITPKPQATEKPNGEKTMEGNMEGRMEGIPVPPNPSGTPTMQKLTFGDFAEALTEDELDETKKLALEYAKTISNKVSEVKVAEDSNKLYSENMLYNKGCIIVYTFTLKGETKSVAIGRINVNSEWKVL